MSLSKLQFFLAASAVVIGGGCARPYGVAVDLGGTGGGDDLAVTHPPYDLAGRDFSSNVPCDLGAGWKVCNNMCLAPTACCTGNDCPSPPTGQALCMQGVCVVSCNAGYRSCNTNCIPNTACCVNTDCNNGAHVATTTCNTGTGMCHIGSCAPGYYDLDGVFQNGCECADQGKARACNSATGLGSVPLGGLFTATGNLPAQGAENWFTVDFQSSGSKAYHPKITLSTNPGNQFQLDVLSNCALSSTLGCGEAGVSSKSQVAWETFYTAGDPPGTTGHADKDGKPAFAAIPAVGANGTVLVRVFRTSNNVNCDTFALTISN